MALRQYYLQGYSTALNIIGGVAERALSTETFATLPLSSAKARRFFGGNFDWSNDDDEADGESTVTTSIGGSFSLLLSSMFVSTNCGL